jgi:hypothetical protein
MTPTEHKRLFQELVLRIWPAMRTETGTEETWYLVLGDMPYKAAADAVLDLAKTTPGFISPAQIRETAARHAGLLPPSEGAAYRAATAVAARGGEGASGLHPAVRTAYFEIGGASAFGENAEYLRHVWRRIYTDAAAADRANVLRGDLGPVLETLAATPARPALEAAAA